MKTLEYLVFNPNLTASSINLCLAFFLFVSAIRLHWQLSGMFMAMDANEIRKRNFYRPLCVQITRAVAIYGFSYCIMDARWIVRECWIAVGNPDDLAWSFLETLGLYIMLMWCRFGTLIVQHSEKTREK